MGGDGDEGDVACVVQEGRLEEAVHGDLVAEELRGHAEDLVAVAMAMPGVVEGDLVVEDQASSPWLSSVSCTLCLDLCGKDVSRKPLNL